MIYRSQKLCHSADTKTEEEINEIIFTGSSGNYKMSLVRNILFVCGPKRFAAEVFLNVLLSARKTIYVAVHVFTSNLLLWALVFAKRNGIDVKRVKYARQETDQRALLL